jgi:hypothetical protein
MRKAIKSERVLVSVPSEVRSWLEARAEYDGSSVSAQVVRSVRERMERATTTNTNRANAANATA